MLTLGSAVQPASAATLMPKCSAGLTGLKLDKVPAVGDVISDGTLTVTITEVVQAGRQRRCRGLQVHVEHPVTAVYVKGSTGFLRYLMPYREFLFAPIKADGTHHSISFVLFCY